MAAKSKDTKRLNGLLIGIGMGPKQEGAAKEPTETAPAESEKRSMLRTAAQDLISAVKAEDVEGVMAAMEAGSYACNMHEEAAEGEME